MEYGFLTPKMAAKSNSSIFLLSCVIRQGEQKHISEILQAHNYAAPGLLPLPHISGDLFIPVFGRFRYTRYRAGIERV
jgi:hypothetical protein